MSATVISDTSCLIFIGKIDLLDFIAKSYETVYVTTAIANEYGLPLPEWIVVRNPTDNLKVKELQSKMDLGEATAIALALEIADCDLLLDDLSARIYALENHLKFTGTLGVLLKAKQQKAISEVLPLLNKLKTFGFRISEAVEKEVLMAANEL